MSPVKFITSTKLKILNTIFLTILFLNVNSILLSQRENSTNLDMCNISNINSNLNSADFTNPDLDEIYIETFIKDGRISAMVKILEHMIQDVVKSTDSIQFSKKQNEETNIKINQIKLFLYQIQGKSSRNKKNLNYNLEVATHRILSRLIAKLISQLIGLRKQIKSYKHFLMNDDLEIEEYENFLPNSNFICDELKSCKDCTANPTCGWCTSSNSCVEGNKQNPLRGGCRIYNFEKCSSTQECSKYTTCNDCIKDVGCGFCSDINLNLNICLSISEKDLCNSNYFHHAWKSDKLGECPVITTHNFINYINSNLHDIELHNRSDISVISNTEDEESMIIDYNNKLEKLFDKKTDEEIQLDRLYRTYNSTKLQLLKIENETNIMDEDIKMTNKTMRVKFMMDRLSDIKEIIRYNINSLQNGTENITDQLFQEVYDRFNNEIKNKTKNSNTTEEIEITNNNTSCKCNETHSDNQIRNSTIDKTQDIKCNKTSLNETSSDSDNSNTTNFSNTSFNSTVDSINNSSSTDKSEVLGDKISSFLEIENSETDYKNEKSINFIQSILNYIDVI